MNSFKRTFGLVAIGAWIGLFVAPEATLGVDTLHVDINGGSSCGLSCSGADWTSTNVFKYIQDALQNATDGDEIWVADGTYYPHEQSCDIDDDCGDSGDTCSNGECVFANPDEQTFNISNPSVLMYGGFDGAETLRTQRTYPTCTDGCSTDDADLDYDGRPCVADSDCGIECLGGEATCDNTANATILSGDVDADDDRCFVNGDCASGETCDVSSGFCSCDDAEADCDSGYACTGGVCVCDNDSDCGTGNFCLQGVCIKNDNANHVVTYDTASATATLDGFIIEGGMANGPGGSDIQGGGITIRNGACLMGGPTIDNCFIHRNYAGWHGAGINDHGSSTNIDNCTFFGNEAEDPPDPPPSTNNGWGGAISIDNGSPVITNSLFVSNSVRGYNTEGGAVWISGRTDQCGTTGCPCTAAASISDSVFIDNSAFVGAAIYVSPQTGTAAKTAPTITDCYFTGHETFYLYANNASPTYRGCTFDDNGSTYDTAGSTTKYIDCDFKNGGGMFMSAAGPTTVAIIGSRFVDNAPHSIRSAGADLTMTNCLMTGGSVISSNHAVSVTLNNCTLTDGAKVTMSNVDAHLTMTNCIVWGNGPDETDQINIAQTDWDITYSTIEGCSPLPGGFCDSEQNYNNTGVDPVFADATNGDYSLNSTSPAIDAGGGAVPTDAYDLDGDGNTSETTPDVALAKRTRDKSGTGSECVDMGAYEYQASPPDCCLTNGDCTGATVCCSEGCCASGETCCGGTCCASGSVCCGGTCYLGECCNARGCKTAPDRTCCLTDHMCYDSTAPGACCTNGDCTFPELCCVSLKTCGPGECE